MNSKPLSSALALVVTGSVPASTPATAPNQDETYSQTRVTRSVHVESDGRIDVISTAVYATESCFYWVRILSQAAASAWLGWDEIAFRLVWLMAAGNLYREEILRNAGQQKVADALRGVVRRN